MPDLQKVCEDHIIDYMDSQNALKILTDKELVLPSQSDKDIREAAKIVLLDDFDRLLETDPEVEEKIFSIKGLMSELLTYKKKKVKSVRRRRASSIVSSD